MWCSRDYSVDSRGNMHSLLYGTFHWSLFVRLCLLLLRNDAMCVRLYVAVDASFCRAKLTRVNMVAVVTMCTRDLLAFL